MASKTSKIIPAEPKKVSKKVKKTSPKDKPKRGPSSFIIFANEHRQEVIVKNGYEKKQISEIGKALGVMWRGLSDAEKDSYKAKAAKTQ